MKKLKKRNISSICKELDTKNSVELDHYYISDMPSLDALRVILYKYSLAILFYKDRIILHNEKEDLHQFRINIRKSRALLKEFSFLFPENIYTDFNEYLSMFATQTNQKRDLDVIGERLEQLGKTHNSIQNNIKQQQSSEHQHIELMLKGQSFMNFFVAYQNILKDEKLLNADTNKETIVNTAKRVLETLHQNIIKKITALEKEYDDKKLHKIRIAFKKLRYLLEEFQYIFGERKIEKMIEKGKSLQTLLGEINDSVNQTQLLHNYFKSNAADLDEGKKVEKELLDKTSKREEKLKKKAMKKLHKFKEKPFRL